MIDSERASGTRYIYQIDLQSDLPTCMALSRCALEGLDCCRDGGWEPPCTNHDGPAPQSYVDPGSSGKGVYSKYIIYTSALSVHEGHLNIENVCKHPSLDDMTTYTSCRIF